MRMALDRFALDSVCSGRLSGDTMMNEGMTLFNRGRLLAYDDDVVIFLLKVHELKHY